jgi:WhiB family redox-sensing transcriptional regulator
MSIEQAWRDEAECLDKDPALFYSTDPVAKALAKNVCGRCVVVNDCLQHAVNTRKPDGIWGGMDIEERENLITAASER